VIHRLPLAPLALALLLWCPPAPAATLGGCANPSREPPAGDGIGGTGRLPGPGDDDGIGGTGRDPGGGDDGVGGTGLSADGRTGVIGTIAGFASICVGETEIEYDARTPIRIDGRRATAAELRVGQVVEVVAAPANGILRAQDVAVNHVLVGPVTAVEGGGERISVMGQPVEVAIADAGAFAVGSAVAVSGMRREDGVIVASDVSRAGDAEPARITGPFDTGRGTVAGTPIDGVRPATEAPGDEVRVVGRWTGDRLRVEQAEVLPPVPFGGRVERIAIEGFARRAPGGDVRIGAFALGAGSAPDVLAAVRDAGGRIRAEGRIRGQQLHLERVHVVPDRPRPPAAGGDVPRAGSRGAPDDPGAGGPGAGGRPEHGPSRGGMEADRPAPPGPDLVPGRPERPERPARPERPERPGRPERPTRPGPPERPRRPERPQPPERPRPPERPHVPARPR
jgi:hypothetical protein